MRKFEPKILIELIFSSINFTHPYFLCKTTLSKGRFGSHQLIPNIDVESKIFENTQNACQFAWECPFTTSKVKSC